MKLRAHVIHSNILLSIVAAGPVTCNNTNIAFSFGGFLQRLGESLSCQRVVYGSWIPKRTDDKYSTTNCKMVYERSRVCIGGRSKLNNEVKTIPCSQQEIRFFQNEKSQKMRQIMNERTKACTSSLQDWYRKDDVVSIGTYWQTFLQDTCAFFAENNTFPSNLQDTFNSYSVKWSEDQKMREMQESQRRIAERDTFQQNLATARQRNARVNRGSKEKHFYGTTENGDTLTVYELLIPISSLQAGRTLGGSHIVDLNLRSYVNTSYNGEVRARIFCAEAQHTGIGANGGLFPLGASYRISGDIGRWACGRFGFYHPPAR